MATMYIVGNAKGTGSASGKSSVWHTGPTMSAYGSVDFWRNSASDEYIHFSGNVGNTLWGIDAYSQYGYTISWCINIGGYTVLDGNSYKIEGGTIVASGDVGYDWGHPSVGNQVDIDVDISDAFNCTNNNTSILIGYFCGQPSGCTKGYPDYQCVGEISTNDITHYNPHSDPTISLNTSSWISKAGASRSINYSYTTDGHSAIIYYNIDNSGDWPSIDNLPRWFRFRYY